MKYVEPRRKLTTSRWTAIAAAHQATTPPWHGWVKPKIEEADKLQLREAARYGDLETAKAHLDQIFHCHTTGKTALMLAAENGHVDIVKLCLEEARACTAGPEFVILDNHALTDEDRAEFHQMMEDVYGRRWLNADIQAHYLQNYDREPDADSSSEVLTNDLIDDAVWQDSSGDQEGYGPPDNTREPTNDPTDVTDDIWSGDSIETTSGGGSQDMEGLFRLSQNSYHRHVSISPSDPIRPNSDAHDAKAYARYVVSKGMSPTGSTALTLAMSNFHKDCVDLLIDREVGLGGVTPLMQAAVRNDLEAIVLHIHTAAMTDINGFTALHYACMFGNLKAIELLHGYQQGDNSFRIDIPTPLMFAAREGHLECVAELVPSMGEIVANNRTALMYAAEHNHVSCIPWLASTANKLTAGNCSALLLAAANGHLACVKLLYALEDNVERSGKETSLIKAIYGDHVEVVRVLAGYSSLVDTARRSPLFHAMRCGNAACIDLIWERRKGLDHVTPLMLAAAKGDLQGIRSNIVQAGRTDGRALTALMYIALSGRLDLDENGARNVVLECAAVEARYLSYDGLSALMYAIRERHASLVELLLPLELSVYSPQYGNILDFAISHGAPQCVTYITDYLRDNSIRMYVTTWRRPIISEFSTNLILAVKEARMDEINKYLYQAQVEYTMQTALQVALQYQNHEAIRLLMKELGCCTGDGTSTLMLATLSNDPIAVSLLVFEATKMSANHRTALMTAASLGHVDCVRVLIEHEAGILTSKGFSALMFAAGSGHSDCVQLLLEREARIQDAQGRTALMTAIDMGEESCAELLAEVEAGMKTHSGHTALMEAAYNGSVNLVQLLLPFEKGMKTDTHYTALLMAMQEGKVDAARLLYEEEREVSQVTDLMWAAFTGDSEGVRRHLDKVGQTTPVLSTALMYACNNGNVECARLLLSEAGMQDDTGYTAMMCAVEADKPACIPIVYAHEAHLVMSDGKTAYDLAVDGSKDSCILAIETCMRRAGM
ncbi:Ankyrin repeat protein 1 [Giardia muris]|uniref:Ankyrin repeat protein 1 n=1 Tax=Giardia muris TaxID=5742 RepID=A0A4Z1STY2_GIAMU|nr:Ankyrin repeat protein 1 [Giardia muris]|eukprot:TNJ29356.1 Ankyrin repeat protein 1 [Giardia muris]